MIAFLLVQLAAAAPCDAAQTLAPTWIDGVPVLASGAMMTTTVFRYESGLTVISIPDDQGSATVTILIGRGSMHDPPGEEGRAELVEHIWLQHPEHRAERAAVALQVDSSTTDAYTRYGACAAAEHQQELFGMMLRQVVVAPLAGVDQGVVDTARSALRADRQGAGVDTWGLRLRWLADQLYPPGHPLAHLGDVLDPAYPRADSLGSVRDQVGGVSPADVVVVVSGPILRNLDDTVRDALPEPPGELVSGSIAPSAPAAPPEPPDPPGPERVRGPGPVPHPTVLVGWTVPGGFADWGALHVLAERMGERARARLDEHRAVRAGWTWCGAIDGPVGAAIVCSAELADGDAADEVADLLVRTLTSSLGGSWDRSTEQRVLVDLLKLASATHAGPDSLTAMTARAWWATGTPRSLTQIMWGTTHASRVMPKVHHRWIRSHRAVVRIIEPAT